MGDRFWAVYKNAAIIYYLRHAILDFMKSCTFVSAGMNKPENNLAATIRCVSCLTLSPEKREQAQEFVLAEMRVMGLLLFAIMSVLL